MPLALRASRPQLIHLHGLWLYHAWTAYRVARSAHIPLIVSPRGMLEPWALRQGRLQKAVAGVLFHRAMLRDATCIVATSAMEARSVRLAGVSAPIFVIPNGVDVPDESHAVRSPASLRTALFLSRIAPKKGLLELLVAWHAVAPAGWRLRIVGPDERGYADTVAHEIRRLGLESSVTLAGAAWGEDKRREYAAADLFALPSHSENFGMVVAEALAAGLPVITTRATPWAELETERCGWWIQTGAAALIPTLRDAVALPESELKAMGARGRQLVAARYAWPRVAEDMARIYCWVTGSGAEPSDLKFPR